MADIAKVSDKIIVIDSGHLVTSRHAAGSVFAQKELLRGVGLDLPPITEFTEIAQRKGHGAGRLRFSTRRTAALADRQGCCRKNELKG